MSAVPPENKIPFKHGVNTRFVLERDFKSFILAVSFIGGGNRSTPRIPPTCPSH
jgi:hypothetical protein